MSRRAATGLGAALALVVLVAPTAAAVEPDPLAPRSLRAMTLSIAASNLDPNPTSGRAFETTRNKVKEILQWADREPDRPVYLVVVHGNFVAARAPRPYDAPAPSGRIIAFVWDSERGLTDFALRAKEIDTEALGSGLSLGLRRAGLDAGS